MWHPDNLEEIFGRLDVGWRSPTKDVKVYLNFEEWNPDDGLMTFDDCEDLERVEVGTWDSVFASTFVWLDPPSIAQAVPMFEGHPLTWENDLDESKQPKAWCVLNRTDEIVLFFQAFSTLIDFVGVGFKFHFRPQIRGYRITPPV